VAARWDGAAWTAHLPTWSLAADVAVRVTGSGPTDLWAVVGATLLHGNGSTWNVALRPQEVGSRIADVWARAADDVWVLGGDGLVHRGNGSGDWQTDDSPLRDPTDNDLHAISGSGPDD